MCAVFTGEVQDLEELRETSEPFLVRYASERVEGKECQMRT